SMDRLRLHDGVVQRARYVARTLFLPGPHHIAAMPLPRGLSFAYVPIKLAHDVVMLPLWRTYRQTLAQAGRLQDALMGSDLPTAIMPLPAKTKLSIERHRQVRVNANRALAGDPNDA